MSKLNVSASSDASDIIELIKQIKAGNSRALNDLLKLYIPQVKAFFRYLHVPDSNIEDLMQETFEKMISKIDSFDESKKFATWLMTIGRNLYIDQYRKDTRGEELLKLQESVKKDENPETATIDKLSVEELLSSLTDKERFLVEMRIFQKLSFAEISEITGEAEVTLRSRFCRIIARLRK